MSFENVLKKYFDKTYTEIDFVKKTYAALKQLGFNNENTIAAKCICRDEISQSIRSVIKHMWGEAFNFSSLAGMFFAGKTGLAAAMHHAPIADGKERYVFYALPHIAVNEEGRIGICKREGRAGESTACGALNAFQKELSSKVEKLKVERLQIEGFKNERSTFNVQHSTFNEIDTDDVEMSLIRMRLLREIPYGHVPDLLELTKITLKAIQADLETTINRVVDTGKSNYAVITGIQINGPDSNYVWPAACYAVVNNEKIQLNV